MRLTTDRVCAIGLLAIFMLAGCDSNSRATIGGATSGSKDSAVAGGRTPRQVVEDYLRDLGAGKVPPGRLTAGFKKLITRPTTDDEKKVGYSDEQARAFVTRFEKANWIVADVAEFGPFIVAHGRAELPGSKSAFAIRLTQRGDDFHADWIQLTERTGVPGSYPTDPDLAGAQDVVRNMLDLLIDRQVRTAQALMLPDWRKSISPLPSDVKPKDGVDYEPGFLDQTLRAWTGGAVSYTISDAKLSASKDGATFVVELEIDGKKVPHSVKVKKDANSGHWLVEAFDK